MYVWDFRGVLGVFGVVLDLACILTKKSIHAISIVFLVSIHARSNTTPNTPKIPKLHPLQQHHLGKFLNFFTILKVASVNSMHCTFAINWLNVINIRFQMPVNLDKCMYFP